MIGAVVRARLCRRHVTACLTEKRMLELERRNSQFVEREAVHHQLRIVGAVVVPHSGVVAADDEVRAAVVLPTDRMPDCFARTGVTHRGREHAQHRAISGVVLVQNLLVRAHANVGRDIVVLRCAYQWVEQQAVNAFHGNFLQVLVRTVYRVAGLESDDGLPSQLIETASRFQRRQAVFRKVRRAGAFDHPYRTAEVNVTLREHAGDAWMRTVRCSEALFGLSRLVVRVLLRHLHNAHDPANGVGQRNLRSFGDAIRFVGFYRECDWKRPHEPIGEAHVVDDALVIELAHEAGEWTQSANADHLEIAELLFTENNGGNRSGAGESFIASCAAELPVYEHTTVWHTGTWNCLTRAAAAGSQVTGGGDVAALLEERYDLGNALLDRLRVGVTNEIRILWRFIGIVDTGKALDLSGECFLVKSLQVARNESVERGIDEYLDELADLPAAYFPLRAVR